MPLIPKRIKYRKRHKGRIKGKSSRGTVLTHGEYGIKVVEVGIITSKQMEAARLAIARTIKKGGKIFFKISTDKPITKKPLETRMGKGKGEVAMWVAPIQPGRIILEIEGISEDIAMKALKVACDKLPFQTKIVSRHKLGVSQ
ncbi:50S ribosomal protein L16 [bacterium]|nr:50S ribosomal protein L16 [bacterium]